MNNKHFLCCLLLAATFLCAAWGKTIQVPNIKSDETLLMRLEELYEADRVYLRFGQLKKIYRKEAIEIVSKKEKPFEYCFENAPEASFLVKGEHRIGGKNYNRGGVVYNFDEMYSISDKENTRET